MKKNLLSLATPIVRTWATGLLWNALMVSVSQSQILYWDTNGSATGSSGGATAAGTWDGGASNWSTSPAGTSSTQPWASINTAWFAAGTNATGAYTVRIAGTHYSTGLHFAMGDVTLTGNTPYSSNDKIISSNNSGFQIYVETGAVARFLRVPLSTTNFTTLNKLGGGQLSWEAPSLTGYTTGILRCNGGTTTVNRNIQIEPTLLEIGATVNASLELAGGRISDIYFSTTAGQNNIVMGVNAGVTGTMTVSNNSDLIFASNWIVGQHGHGNLTINNQGAVYGYAKKDTKMILAANPGSTGTVQVNTGGLLYLAGENGLSRGAGTANFQLSGGALKCIRQITDFSTTVPITVSNNATIANGSAANAYFSGALSGDGSLVFHNDSVNGNILLQGSHPYTGAITVSNGGLVMSGSSTQMNAAASLSVGQIGSSRLTLGNGAKCSTTTFMRFGNTGQQGVGSVSDSGSLLAAGTFMEVGSSASGTLEIGAGGRVTSGSTTTLGVMNGSLGLINLSGNGSSLEVGTTCFVGYQSTGILTIGNGGTVTVGGALELGSIAGGSGSVIVRSGGTLRVGGTQGVRLGAGVGVLALDGGTWEIHQNSLTSTAPISLANASTIQLGSLNATLGGLLSGSGSLTKLGSGTLYMTAANSYAGGTTVHGDVVVSAGNSLGSGPVILPNGRIHSTGTFSRDHQVTLSTGSILTASGFMEFGVTGTGTLAVGGGSEVSTPGSIAFGVNAGSVGQGDIVGTGGISGTQSSTLSAGGNLLIGYLGSGGISVGTGGTVHVGGQLRLGNEIGSSGTFTLNSGGTLQVGGNNGIARGAGTATVNLAGGLLKVTGSSLTTSVSLSLTGGATIDTSGVEATLSGTITGPANLTKTGGGILSLTAANNMTGSLINWGGTVRATTPDSLPSGNLALFGGTVHLDFAGTATVQSLTVDGVAQSGGIWGGPDSTAPNKSSLFTGTGLLDVLSSTLPPVFNSQTQAGLKRMLDDGALDLFTATGVSPIGGVFSGPGVSGSSFSPSTAGYGLHTITYSVSNQSATFDIAVLGGLSLEEEGGAIAGGNLALSGTAFAKDLFPHPNHSISGLNNGAFGNSGSWIGNSAGSFAGIAFGSAKVINRIGFGRDNTAAFSDRSTGFYAVQFTNDADPSSPSAVWTVLGAVDYRAGGTAGVNSAALRHLYRFSPVTATAIRILPGSPDTAIDELEVYASGGVFVPGNLTLLQEGGKFAPGNLAPAGTAFAQNVIGVGSHAISGVNDGIRGNASSWIGATGESFVGINLGASRNINRLAFGRDNTGEFTDRTMGRYMVQYTMASNPDASTPNAQWINLGTIDYQTPHGPLFSQPSARHLFGFPTVQATGLRLVTSSAGAAIAIDEIELYQARAAWELSRDTQIAVMNNSTVDYGFSHAGNTVIKTFTIRNSGTDQLSLGNFVISGNAATDFILTPPVVSSLAPGESTSFTLTFSPVEIGPRLAQLNFTTNDESAETGSIVLSGTGLAPTFNAATQNGLTISRSAAAVDLSAATAATPPGGTFDGPGVANGLLNPSGLSYGLHTLRYTRNGVSGEFRISIVGELDLLQTGGSSGSGNLALTAMTFAQNEIGIEPHAISKLNDGLYGNTQSWIAGSARSFAGLSFGSTPVVVNRIAFGRDNTGTLTDRCRAAYILQYTTVPNPSFAENDSWTSIGAVDTRALNDPGLRRLYAFPAMAVTGLRLITESEGELIGIDEFETYNSLTPLESWRVLTFQTASNTGLFSDQADYDNDGVPNIAEFAFGLDPKNPNDRHVPEPTRTGGQMEIRFTPPPGVTGVIYGVEWSSTLQQNDWLPLPNTGTPPEFLFTLPTASRDKLFFRHVLTNPGD